MKKYPKYKPSGVEWIGEIPEGWEIEKLRHIGQFTSSGIDKKINEDEPLVKIINYTDVYGNATLILNSNRNYMEVSCPEQKRLEHQVKKGDLIFTPSSETIVDIGLSALVEEDLDNTAYSYHVLRFRFEKNIIHSFRKYLCNNHFVLNQFSANAKGTTRQILNRENFNSTLVIIPKSNEQTAIANYLDDKTAKIDTLIEKKKKLIELLKEERTAVINQAVTRGINPNVKLKESGIDWLGKIPEHWEVKKIKHCCYVKGRVGWKGLKASEFLENGFAYLVTGTDFKNGLVDWENCYFIDEVRYDDDPFIQLKQNDLLVTKDGTIGKLAIAKDFTRPACLNSGIFVVRTITKLLTINYLYWLLFSNVFKEFNLYTSYGSTIQHLYQNVFVEFAFCIPPLFEQRQIVQYIETETKRIDSTISKIEKEIELLAEYRTALISEVVTGKIKVC